MAIRTLFFYFLTISAYATSYEIGDHMANREKWEQHWFHNSVLFIIIMIIATNLYNRKYELKKKKVRVIGITLQAVLYSLYIIGGYLVEFYRFVLARSLDSLIEFYVYFSQDVLVWYLPLQLLLVFFIWTQSTKKDPEKNN